MTKAIFLLKAGKLRLLFLLGVKTAFVLPVGSRLSLWIWGGRVEQRKIKKSPEGIVSLLTSSPIPVSLERTSEVRSWLTP